MKVAGKSTLALVLVLTPGFCSAAEDASVALGSGLVLEAAAAPSLPAPAPAEKPPVAAPAAVKLNSKQMAEALGVPEQRLPDLMKALKLNDDELQEVAQVAKKLGATLDRLMRLSKALRVPIQQLEKEIYTPRFEKVELDLLQKLAAQGSGKILHSNNNRLSFDAWKQIPDLYRRVGLNHFGVEWFNTSIYEWEGSGPQAVKVLRPMHMDHYKELIFNRLPMVVNEPAVSTLSKQRMVEVKNPKTGRTESVPLVVRAAGFDYETQPETTVTELGAAWANLARLARNRNTALTLRVGSNLLSMGDMEEILESGGRIELLLSKPIVKSPNKPDERNRFDDYDKLMDFLTTLRARNLHTRMTVRYNNANLDLFLLDSREGRQHLRNILGIPKNPL
jgi:hypothetical protein